MIECVDVDHVLILSETPKADLELLQTVTGFPEAWPYRDFGAIQTGAVWAGKMAIEVARLDGARNIPTRLAGLALSTSQAPWDLAEALRAADIKHVPPTFVSADPAREMAWTNTVVGGALDSEPRTFWLGRRFGGRHGLSRWLARVADGMARSPRGLRSLNAVIQGQLLFFLHFDPADEAQRRRTLAKADFASRFGGLDAGDYTVSIDLDLAPDSRAATTWKTKACG